MGRSVSVPYGAVAVVYQDVSYMEESFEWDDYVEDLTYRLKEMYPSLVESSRWFEREERVILENNHALFVLSEYCGLASLSIVPLEESNLAEYWCEQVAPKFEKEFGQYRKVGTFSNGEAVYEKVG